MPVDESRSDRFRLIAAGAAGAAHRWRLPIPDIGRSLPRGPTVASKALFEGRLTPGRRPRLANGGPPAAKCDPLPMRPSATGKQHLNAFVYSRC